MIGVGVPVKLQVSLKVSVAFLVTFSIPDKKSGGSVIEKKIKLKKTLYQR